jgi:hypothetical protein
MARMKAGRVYLLSSAVIALSACSTVRNGFENRRGYYTSNTPDLQAPDVRRFVSDENANLNRFVLLSGVEYDRRPIEPPTDLIGGTAQPNIAAETQFALIPKKPEDWNQVITAGMHYVDVRCDRFIDALFWLNRIRETSSREIRFVGAASAAALTILSASTELIGLAPLAFGLLDQTVNNIGQGLLYDLPPATVRTIVEEQQTAYVQAMQGKSFNTRSLALGTIQGYVTLCLPATIEAEVNRAITSQRFRPVNYGPPGPPPPPPPPPPPGPAAVATPPPPPPPAQSPPRIEPAPRGG